MRKPKRLPEYRQGKNEKTLMDQLDSMKTAFRGYDKEATCELLQTLIRSMETEKKEEHRVLLQKNQRLVKEKEALTTQMAELLMKVDSLESENQRMMEQQNTMQKKYEERKMPLNGKPSFPLTICGNSR